MSVDILKINKINIPHYFDVMLELNIELNGKIEIYSDKLDKTLTANFNDVILISKKTSNTISSYDVCIYIYEGTTLMIRNLKLHLKSQDISVSLSNVKIVKLTKNKFTTEKLQHTISSEVTQSQEKLQPIKFESSLQDVINKHNITHVCISMLAYSLFRVSKIYNLTIYNYNLHNDSTTNILCICHPNDYNFIKFITTLISNPKTILWINNNSYLKYNINVPNIPQYTSCQLITNNNIKLISSELFDNNKNIYYENIDKFNNLIKNYTKLLFISSDYPDYGGAATNCYDMIQYYTLLNHDVSGIFITENNIAKKYGQNITIMNQKNFDLWIKINKIKYDLIVLRIILMSILNNIFLVPYIFLYREFSII